jgi:hypothetical protein
MKHRATEEDYAAFEEFRREAMKACLQEEAEQQERQGGPPLTEMNSESLNNWLRAFHAEANESLRREREGRADKR